MRDGGRDAPRQRRNWFVRSIAPRPRDIGRDCGSSRRHTSSTRCLKACLLDPAILRACKTYSSVSSRASMGLLMFVSFPKDADGEHVVAIGRIVGDDATRWRPGRCRLRPRLDSSRGTSPTIAGLHGHGHAGPGAGEGLNLRIPPPLSKLRELRTDELGKVTGGTVSALALALELSRAPTTASPSFVRPYSTNGLSS